MCESKVNVRTGRKGWFKRTNAVDKTTSLAITVHDSDDALGASSDLHTKIFEKSAKSLQTPSSNDAIDAMTLPFFQLGGHPLQTQALKGASSMLEVSSSGARSKVLALGDIGTPHGPQAIPSHALADAQMNVNDDEGSNSEKETDCCQPVNPFNMLHHALPTHSQHLANAKAKARSAPAAAKSLSKAAAKSGTGRKRKTTDADDKENSQHVKILRLDGEKIGKGRDTTSATNTAETASHANSADEKVFVEFNEMFKHHMVTSLTVLGDADATVNDFLKAQQKEIVTTMNKIKTKIKSIKRRADKGGKLAADLDSMIPDLQSAQQTVHALLNCVADQTIVDTVKAMDKKKWRVSAAVFKRAYKCSTLSYLKFGDWMSFVSSRSDMTSTLGFTNGELHFELMTSELLQRLLKALPNKVSCRYICKVVVFLFSQMKMCVTIDVFENM